MAKVLRVIDSGVLEGRYNIAVGQAIVDAHRAGSVPDTLRFLRFPPTALVGRHQALAQEVDLDFCREQDIGVVRRITGGGAIYLDPGQLGWELALSRKSLGNRTLPELTQAICEAAASGLSDFGINARFRPRNDIEVDGQKISGTGGFFDGDTLFFQGTVLVDMDPARMVQALRVPQAKLAKRELDSAEQRVVTLNKLLAEKTPELHEIQSALVQSFCRQFGWESQPGGLNSEEEQAARQAFEEEIGTAEFVHEIDEPDQQAGTLSGSQTGPGGTITAYVRLEGPARNMIRSILLTGDFFVTPPRVVYDLEACLRGAPVDKVQALTREFFENSPIDALSVSPDDFVTAIQNALARS